jgi:putative Mg2+ transporter-C (MgtC) family protein
MVTMTWTEALGRLGAALIVGALIGLERERKNRPAGFRTMILISLGSAGFMVAGVEAIADFEGHTGQAEISRILQGLMSGIGFLGAGAVIQNKKAVRGLTTAAAVWVTAAIGAMCGLGHFMMALLLGGMALFTLVVLEVVEDRYFPDRTDERDEGIGPSRLRGDTEEVIIVRDWNKRE